MESSAHPYCSLTSALDRRSCLPHGSTLFWYHLTRQRSQHMQRLLYPRLYNNQSRTPILSMNVCHQGRYLLTGDKNGTLSIYDLAWSISSSTRGGQHHHQQQLSQPNQHAPIVQVTAPSRFLLSTAWYPVDTGMFLTAAREGTVHVWDTNAGVPVLECRPYFFDESSSPLLSCMKVSKYSSCSSFGTLVAVGSPRSSLIKLVDIRSGATTHSLTGHDRPGVACLDWSPSCPYSLVSGDTSGAVLLWDVRKPRAKITALNPEQRENPRGIVQPYFPDYRHLQKSSAPSFSSSPRTRKRRPTTRPSPFSKNTQPASFPSSLSSPNRQSQQQPATSSTSAHTGSGGCIGVAFHPTGHYLVSAGKGGTPVWWDLRGRGCPVPGQFMSNNDSQRFTNTNGRVPLTVTHTHLWTRRGPHLCGYDLEHPDAPTTILKGHLGLVQAIEPVGDSATGRLVSSASDGLLLLWGPARDNPPRGDNGDNNEERGTRLRNTKEKRQLPQEDQDDW